MKGETVNIFDFTTCSVFKNDIARIAGYLDRQLSR
jgi:hypothetical protein